MKLLALLLLAVATATPCFMDADLDFPQVLGTQSADLTLTNSMAECQCTGFPVSCSPDTVPASGTTLEYYNSADGEITVRFVNRGTLSVNPASMHVRCYLENYNY